MSTHKITLPEYISKQLAGTSKFSTSYIITKSGQEIRSSDCEHVARQYSLNSCKLSFDQFQEFNDFFLARRGMKYGFYIKDHFDFKVIKQVIAKGDGKSQSFRFNKSYPDSILPYLRKISRIIKDSLKVAINNKDTSKFKLNNDSNVITLLSPLKKSETLTASFEFLIPVRFAHDNYKYEFCSDGTVMLHNIEIYEVIL